MGETEKAFRTFADGKVLKVFVTQEDASAWARLAVRKDHAQVAVQENVDGSWEIVETHHSLVRS